MVAPRYTDTPDLMTPAYARGGAQWWSAFNSPSGVAPALVLDYENDRYMADAVASDFDTLHTFARASTATYRDSSGVIQTAASGVQRLDHDKDGNPLGLLMEEARTNELTRSQELDHSDWNKINATISTDATTAPDGTLSADKLGDNGATGTNVVEVRRNVTVSTSTSYALSVFVKKDQLDWFAIRVDDFTTPALSDAYFDLNNGVLGTVSAGFNDSGIEDYGSGWYRCWVTFTTDAADTVGKIQLAVAEADGDLIVDLDGTSSIFLWGAQLEQGAFPTSYIPTTTVAVTRAAETATIPTSAFGYNSSVGTLLSEFFKSKAQAGVVCSLNAGVSTANRIEMVYRTNGLNIAESIAVGVTLARFDTAITLDVASKLAIAAKNSDHGCAHDGSGITATTTNAGALAAVTQLTIGHYDGQASSINDHIRSIAYYPERLSDADLVGLTT